MNDYYKVQFTFSPYSEVESDVLSALLCDAGFESFVPEDPILTAYVKKELYDASAVEEALKNPIFGSEIIWTVELEEGQDWNAEWEKNYFKPMLLGDRCVVHSSFHTDYEPRQYDIVIDPKMAFGTGHHETTALMSEQIMQADLAGRDVLDMGTGTGILAILASMCGARRVVGVEIDPPAYENAVENVALNHVDNIDVRLGDASAIADDTESFDYLLANINRNIILHDIDKYANALRRGGYMQLSGFYTEDSHYIVDEAERYGLRPVLEHEKNNWAMILLKKA